MRNKDAKLRQKHEGRQGSRKSSRVAVALVRVRTVVVTGDYVRVGMQPERPGLKYRLQDVGDKGHTKRLAAYNPKTKKWSTQTWLFPIEDVQKGRSKTMKQLRALGIQPWKLQSQPAIIGYGKKGSGWNWSWKDEEEDKD